MVLIMNIGSIKKGFFEEMDESKNAIILAAGLGMRMVPVTFECPKALVSVKGEVLIERLIRQLHEVDVFEIKIVVGFMKERFEYLIDKFNVQLIVNPEYRTKNNLSSLYLVNKSIKQTYIIPGDIWCRTNPFRKKESNSWYLVSRRTDKNSFVHLEKDLSLKLARHGVVGNHMIGISYISQEVVPVLLKQLETMANDPLYNTSFWEEALICKSGEFMIHARIAADDDYAEINTFDDLRNIDSDSDNLNTQIIDLICGKLDANPSDISDIRLLKKGMTNRSFIFSCKHRRYIMRIPGEGTWELIDRKGEAEVYEAIKDLHLSDDVIYIDPISGYKLSAFIEKSRTCDPSSFADVRSAMEVLRNLHRKSVHVDHSFNLFEQIDFYESLMRNANPDVISMYDDYVDTKKSVLLLRGFIEEHSSKSVLCHIDPVPDNFLFDADDSNLPRLIDWEYAGMADYHIDIAMFCIYSLYGKQEIDKTIELYFLGEHSVYDKILIYCYIAACGLLWSNWCEYKQSFGVEFGEYALHQYRYAKDFSKIAYDGIIALGKDENEQD